MFNRILCVTALAGLMAIAASAAARTNPPPATDLGKSWPNAPDVSASPHWHVYVFVKDGIRYIQVNDLNGTVRGAVATANGLYLALPMGRDAQHVSTPQDPSAAATTTTDTAAASDGETVYQDSNVKVTATSLSTGAVLLNAAAVSSDSSGNGTGHCDPAECSTHLQ